MLVAGITMLVVFTTITGLCYNEKFYKKLQKQEFGIFIFFIFQAFFLIGGAFLTVWSFVNFFAAIIIALAIGMFVLFIWMMLQ